jgi:phosphoglycolate phosphatase
MVMKSKAHGCVIFDHDGTLVDSLEVVVHASNQVLTAFGKDPKPATLIVAGMVHPTAPRLGLLAETDDPDVQRDMARLYNDLALRSSGLAKLYPGIDAMLANIEGMGWRQAVLSNSAGAFIRSILGRLGVATRFFGLVGENDMPAPKPDPRGLLVLLQTARCEPSSAIYVGDSRTDLLTARAAGVRAVGVTWGAHSRDELAPLGFDALVDAPSELVQALQG